MASDTRNPGREDKSVWPPQLTDLRELDNLLTCSVCSQYYNQVVALPVCLHHFCQECIKSHLEVSKSCPVCKKLSRGDLKPDKLVDDIVSCFTKIRVNLFDLLSPAASKDLKQEAEMDIRSPKQSKVSCPNCSTQMNSNLINSHLDWCLSKTERRIVAVSRLNKNSAGETSDKSGDIRKKQNEKGKPLSDKGNRPVRETRSNKITIDVLVHSSDNKGLKRNMKKSVSSTSIGRRQVDKSLLRVKNSHNPNQDKSKTVDSPYHHTDTPRPMKRTRSLQRIVSADNCTSRIDEAITPIISSGSDSDLPSKRRRITRTAAPVPIENLSGRPLRNKNNVVKNRNATGRFESVRRSGRMSLGESSDDSLSSPLVYKPVNNKVINASKQLSATKAISPPVFSLSSEIKEETGKDNSNIQTESEEGKDPTETKVVEVCDNLNLSYNEPETTVDILGLVMEEDTCVSLKTDLSSVAERQSLIPSLVETSKSSETESSTTNTESLRGGATEKTIASLVHDNVPSITVNSPAVGPDVNTDHHPQNSGDMSTKASFSTDSSEEGPLSPCVTACTAELTKKSPYKPSLVDAGILCFSPSFEPVPAAHTEDTPKKLTLGYVDNSDSEDDDLLGTISQNIDMFDEKDDTETKADVDVKEIWPALFRRKSPRKSLKGNLVDAANNNNTNLTRMADAEMEFESPIIRRLDANLLVQGKARKRLL